MRTIVVLGALALSAALGAGAAYADNPNVATWSPYAVMSFNVNPAPAPMVESRASAVSTYGGASVVTPNGNVPTWSPYTLAPQGH